MWCWAMRTPPQRVCQGNCSQLTSVLGVFSWGPLQMTKIRFSADFVALLGILVFWSWDPPFIDQKALWELLWKETLHDPLHFFPSNKPKKLPPTTTKRKFSSVPQKTELCWKLPGICLYLEQTPSPAKKYPSAPHQAACFPFSSQFQCSLWIQQGYLFPH